MSNKLNQFLSSLTICTDKENFQIHANILHYLGASGKE